MAAALSAETKLLLFRADFSDSVYRPAILFLITMRNRAWAWINAHVPIGFNRAAGHRSYYLRHGPTSLQKSGRGSLGTIVSMAKKGIPVSIGDGTGA